MHQSILFQHAWLVWMISGAAATIGVAATIRAYQCALSGEIQWVKRYCRLTCGLLVASCVFNCAMLAGMKVECLDTITRLTTASRLFSER